MIPSWCSAYVGLPYEEVSCFDLVKLVYKEIYAVEISGILDQTDLVKSGFWVEVEEAFDTADILVFKDSKVKRHVGILLDGAYMLHADQHCGTIIDRWVAPNWKPRIDSIFRCDQIN